MVAEETFTPSPWLAGPHLQTMGARLLRRRGGVRFERERLATPDGDELLLDVVVDPPSPGGGLVLVLHGLEGSARSGYALETYRQLARHGLAAVGLNFRSCGGELNHAPRFYHSGETGDAALVLGHLAARFPGRPLAMVGVSLGGNVLLRYLGERGAEAAGRVRAAAAVSVPFDLAAGARHLERGSGRLYVRTLLRSLKRKVVLRAADLDGRVDPVAARRATTFRAFDDAVTAPLHGFADASDYYRRASSGPVLGAIRVPTLLIQSRDDPFLPAEAIPVQTIRANPALRGEITTAGGHVGFVAGNPLRPRFWAEERAAAYLAEKMQSSVKYE